MPHTVHLVGNHELVTHTALSQFAHDPWERPDLARGSRIRLVAVQSYDWDNDSALFTDGGTTLGAELGLAFTGTDLDTWVMYQPQEGPCANEMVYANLREFEQGQARVIVQAAMQAVRCMAERHQAHTVKRHQAYAARTGDTQ